MMKHSLLPTILSTTAAFILAGCAAGSKIDVPKKEFDSIKYKKLDSSVYLIPVKKMVYKKDNLKRATLPQKKLLWKFSGKFLGEIEQIGGLPVYCDDEVRYKKIPSVAAKEKTVKETLDLIASVTDTYWSYDGNVIRFIRTKTVTYKIPAITPQKLATIYNISDSKDLFNVDQVKNDLFDELVQSLDAIIGNEAFGGTIKEKIEREKHFLYDDAKEKNAKSVTSRQENEAGGQKEDLSKEKRYDKSEVALTTKEDEAKNSKKKGIKSQRSNRGGHTKKGSIGVKTPIIEPLIDDQDINKRYSHKKKENNLNDSNTLLEKSTKISQKDKKLQKEKAFDNTHSQKKSKKEKRIFSETISLTKTIDPKTKPYSVIKEAGLVIVKVTKDKESEVDEVINSIVKTALSNMVMLDLYILEVTDKKLKEFNSKFDALIQRRGDKMSFSVSESRAGFSYNDILPNIKGINFSSIVSFLTDDGESRILQEPKLLSLPNIPSRIKATVDYPYLEPQQISVGGTNPQLAYQIKYVSDGLDLAVVSNVVNDNIFLNIGMRINQYLGKESVNAGTLGSFDVPIQSPRILNSSFRLQAGDIVLLGGIKKLDFARSDGQNLLIPVRYKKHLIKRNIVIVASPRLVRFVEE